MKIVSECFLKIKKGFQSFFVTVKQNKFQAFWFVVLIFLTGMFIQTNLSQQSAPTFEYSSHEYPNSRCYIAPTSTNIDVRINATQFWYPLQNNTVMIIFFDASTNTTYIYYITCH